LKVRGGGGGRFVRIDPPKTILGKATTSVKKPYHMVSRDAKTAAGAIEEFAKANGQILLPLVELITQARMAVDEAIDSIGRQTIETILSLSAEEVAGPRTPRRPAATFAGMDHRRGASVWPTVRSK
jgi:hypothetical protein